MLVLIIAAFAPLARGEDTPPRFKIGIVAPFTGPLAEVGESIKNSAALAKAAFDTAGRVDLLVEDDGFNPQKSVAIVRKMIAYDKVSGVVIFGSGTALSIADIVEKSGIPTFTLALSEKPVENRRLVFRYFLTARSIAEALQGELARRGYSSMAIVTAQQEGMASIRDELLKLYHPRVMLQEEVLPNESDFKALALKVAQAKPPVTVMLTFGFQSAIFAKQLRADRYGGDLASGPPLQTESTVKSADGALEGAWIATADDRSGKEYFDRYRASFHVAPVPDGTYAYDAVRLLIEGLYHGAAADYIRASGKVAGIFGEAMLGEKQTFAITTAIKTVKNGAFITE
jgi:branched-chain amino acid transport system substrate-binding protein